MPDQDILNIDGAAALLGVSVKTFSKVLREGDVPGRKVGREWKFSRQALIDWIGGSQSADFLDHGDGSKGTKDGSGLRRGGDGFSVDSM
jgi:excisionase family DNA binding protein